MNKHFSMVKRIVALSIAVFYGMGMPSSFCTPLDNRDECSAAQVPEGAINGVFSVSPTLGVYFSQGNLQYQASTDTWRFAPNQYDFVGIANNQISSTNEGWIDLFGWGTSGYNHGAVCYQPWSTSLNDMNYQVYGSSSLNLFDQSGQAEWGYNAISNGGDADSLWRTLTKEEWAYLLDTRITPSGIRYAKGTVDGVKGLILLPDNWRAFNYVLNGTNVIDATYDVNMISASDWLILQEAGAVFLPAAGSRYDKTVKGYSNPNSQYASGYYWTSQYQEYDGAYVFHFIKSGLMPSYTHYRYVGLSVRVVCPVTSCTVTARANPVEGGSVTINNDADEYKDIAFGDTCVLAATANEGYTFINWSLENGRMVSTEPTVTFLVHNPECYVANFVQGEVQRYALNEGFNWVSTYIEQEGIDGLQILENSLGDNGLIIKSQNDGFNSYLQGFGWYGILSSLRNEEMVNVRTMDDCPSYMYGDIASLAAHPITLNPGLTWIGFPSQTPMDLTEAFSNINPKTGDVLKSQHDGFSSYLEGLGWYGVMMTMNPGRGYIYKSTNTEPVTFVYPETTAKGGWKANLNLADNHWVPNMSAYPDNMTLTAIVELDGEELQGGQYELAAFADDECRGSVKLIYVEPLDRYVAFLTVAGDETVDLRFGLYDSETGMECFSNQGMMYVTNADLGNLKNPFRVCFNNNTNLDEVSFNLQVYPNPINRGATINLGADVLETGKAQVRMVNALGVETMCVTTQLPATVKAPNTPGIYTLILTVEGKGSCRRKLVVE